MVSVLKYCTAIAQEGIEIEKTKSYKKIKQVEPSTELVETDNNETKALSEEDEG